MSSFYTDKLESLSGRTAWGYARASTDDQCDEDRDSMPRQIESFKKVSERFGLKLKEIFQAENESAKGSKNIKNPRGTYQKMLNLLSRGDVLLMENPDRHTRGGKHDGLDALRVLIQKGVDIIFTDNEKNRFKGLTLVDAENYEDDGVTSEYARGKSENTRKSGLIKESYSSRYDKIKDGRFVRLSRIPFWIRNGARGRYKGEPGDDQYYLRPEKVAAVKRIFELYLKGYRGLSILRMLAEEGLTSSRGNNRWCLASVTNTLMNKSVLGFYINETEGIEIKVYPEIISKDDFDAVQTRLKERRRVFGIKEKRIVVFTANLGSCKACGGPLRREGKITKPYFVCYNHKFNSKNKLLPHCKSAMIRSDRFEESFKKLMEYSTTLSFVASPKPTYSEDRLTKLEEQMKTIKRQQLKLVTELADTSLPSDAIKTRLRNLYSEEKECKGQITDENIKKYKSGTQKVVSDYRELFDSNWNDESCRLKIKDAIADIIESLVLDLNNNSYTVKLKGCSEPIDVSLLRKTFLINGLELNYETDKKYQS